MKVNVVHPAPVEFLPRRGSVARRELVTVRTPVEIRAVTESEAPEIGRLVPEPGDRHTQVSVSVREHGARRWMRILDPVSDRVGDCPGTVSAEALSAYLSGSLAGNEAGVVEAYFSATPVSGPLMIGEPERGREEGDLRMGRLLADGREGASSRLRAYLDEDVILIGGIPHARFRPTLVHSNKSARAFDVALTRHPEPSSGRRFDPGDIAAAYRNWPGEARSGGVEAARRIEELAGTDVGETAVLFNINALPRLVAKGLEGIAKADMKEVGAVRARTSAMLSAAASLAIRGRVGGIDLMEAQSAVSTLQDGVEYILGHDAPWETMTAAVSAKSYLNLAKDRIEHLTAPAPEDVASLGGLIP